MRYRRFALNDLLQLNGSEIVQIKPMGTGAFGVAWQCLQGPLPEPIAMIGRTLARWLDGLFAKAKPGNLMGLEFYPLGYFFEARRAG